MSRMLLHLRVELLRETDRFLTVTTCLVVKSHHHQENLQLILSRQCGHVMFMPGHRKAGRGKHLNIWGKGSLDVDLGPHAAVGGGLRFAVLRRTPKWLQDVPR